MMDNSENDGPRRPGTRPFVGGRPASQQPTTIALVPSRPFSLAGVQTKSASNAMTSTSTTIDAHSRTPTPLWTVAVYSPALEREEQESRELFYPPRPENPSHQVAEASLALAEDLIEAQRHANGAAAADALEIVARKLRRGEILLPPGASMHSESALVSSVLAALLGGNR